GADQSHELVHAAIVIAEAEARRGNAEACIIGRDADVAGQRDADPTAHAIAVDHRHQRLLQRGERVLATGRDPPVLLLVGHVLALVLELGYVGARHERLDAADAEYDPPTGLVLVQAVSVLLHYLH